MWLKRPGNLDDANALIRATHQFRRIRGVTDIQVGRGMAPQREGIDQSFDICAVIRFKDADALQRFNTDKRHVQAIEMFLKPLVRRFIVYNFTTE